MAESKDLRYWSKIEDVPTGVVFKNADGWECVWTLSAELAPGWQKRELMSCERVPVEWRNETVPFEDQDDLNFAMNDPGPFLEVDHG